MTKREKEVYDFILSYWKENRYAPTFQEIGEGVGLKSFSSVHRYVNALTEKGMLFHPEGKMRALVPVSELGG